MYSSRLSWLTEGCEEQYLRAYYVRVVAFLEKESERKERVSRPRNIEIVLSLFLADDQKYAIARDNFVPLKNIQNYWTEFDAKTLPIRRVGM